MSAEVLRGLRVLEFGGSASVAYAGRLLASLGADVIHLTGPWDRPLADEGPFPPGGGPGALYNYLHMGKRLSPLDPGEASHGTQFRDHLGSAELLVMGGARERALVGEVIGPWPFGEGHAISSVTVTPFGLSGPWSTFEATDLLAFLAFGRFSDAGLAGRPPIGYSLHAAELYGGTVAAAAGLAAVRHGRRTGTGLRADISLAECVLSSPDRAFTLFSFVGQPIPRPEFHREVFVVSSDGALVLINTGLAWTRTAALLGQPQLVEDPRFSTLAARSEHGDEVYGLLAVWAAERTLEQIVDALAEHRVMGSQLYWPHDVLQDSQYLARDAFDELQVPGMVAVRAPAAPFKVNGVRPHLSAARLVDTPCGWFGELPVGNVGHQQVHPLDGVRVIDLGELYAGPSACSFLGDLGADVIKVENVQRMPAVVRGDRHPPAQAFGYFRSESGSPSWERFHLFHTVERNKRGVTLDLKAQEGRRLFLELVASSQALVSNYTPRALRRLRVTHDRLRDVNPGLSFVHLPGFGADGPLADRVSVGPVAEALSGHWRVRGYPDTSELWSNQTVWSDAIAGGTACLLAIAGILASERDGEGFSFDLSQAEALTCFVAPEVIDWNWNRERALRHGDKHRSMSPHGCYPVRGEDSWVVIAVRDDDEWRRFAAAIGRDDLAADPELATFEKRKRLESKIDAIIAAWTSPRDATEVAESLQAAGVPCVPALHDDQLVGHPQIAARGMLENVSHTVVGGYLNPATPFRFEGVPRVPRRPPNLLGQHNAEVLGQFPGCTAEMLSRLEDLGVIGTTFV